MDDKEVVFMGEEALNYNDVIVELDGLKKKEIKEKVAHLTII